MTVNEKLFKEAQSMAQSMARGGPHHKEWLDASLPSHERLPREQGLGLELRKK